MEAEERLQAEIELLEAMYPDQILYDQKASEVKYSCDHGSFKLRLPFGYLINSLPEVLSASIGRKDGRGMLKETLSNCSVGEEVLDSVISSFNDIVQAHQDEDIASSELNGESQNSNSTAKATVIVWLHHLLNTNKRKQALSPPSSAVSGITKPGYPGVLVYSGPADGVNEHVNELRALNWQAFSVRFESDEEWHFNHGTGVKEFESMKEVVADIEEARKEDFMEAMRMK